MPEVCKFSSASSTWWDGYETGRKEALAGFVEKFRKDWDEEKAHGTQSVVDWMDACEKIADIILEWQTDSHFSEKAQEVINNG